MRALLVAGAVLASLSLGAVAGATHPESNGPCPGVQYVPSDSQTTSYPVYVTIDEILSNDYLFSIWVYAESNGVDGLQRDDPYCYTEGYDTGTSDTIIF